MRMKPNTKEGRVIELVTPRGPARFRSVLIPIDLTPSSDRALARVARLPLTDTARLTLLHVVPGILPAHEQRIAEQDATKALIEEAQHLAKSLPRTTSVEAIVRVGSVAKEIGACARRVRAELIVVGRGNGSVLREAFLGSTAERVVRRSQLPVLLVRNRARAPYKSPALAIEDDQAASNVVELLLRAFPTPRPSVAVIHAFDAPYQGLAYPSLADHVAERKAELKLKASRRIAKLLARFLADKKVPLQDTPTWKHHIAYGSARTVIEKVTKQAEIDLLVIGTHGYTGVAYVLLGTVAGDVLRHVACDVLIVPPRPRKA
jgi:nucleotide-binding universal stress UspA family protein